MSTTHTVHDDVHEHGLADACDRCNEHAQQPLLNLDNETLSNLFARTCAGEPARSENEGIAMFNLERILLQTVELAKLDPTAYAKYLKQRGVILPA